MNYYLKEMKSDYNGKSNLRGRHVEKSIIYIQPNKPRKIIKKYANK
jgi:hypothetical protein